MSGLVSLIRKRYQAPRWVVIEEVNEATGSNAGRRADAVAIGIWPSDGMLIHGFECKISRTDIQKELADPRKADAIGKYCDHWWLVVADLNLITGLEIPATWGILYRNDSTKPEAKRPDGKTLLIKRKAPKRPATPINRHFQAAVIRRVTEGWVSHVAFEDYKKGAHEKARKDVERERADRREDIEGKLEEVTAKVTAFEEASGLKILGERSPTWMLRDLGEVTSLVVKAREIAGAARNQHWRSEAANIVAQEVRSLEQASARHKGAAASVELATEHLRAFVATIEET